MASLATVRIRFDKKGKIHSVINVHGREVPFSSEVVETEEECVSYEEITRAVVPLFAMSDCDATYLQRLNQIAAHTTRTYVFPSTHANDARFFPHACVFEYAHKDPIPETLPLNMNYATAMSIAELDTRVGDLAITEEYFQTPAFQRKWQQALTELFVDEDAHEFGDCPGLLLKGEMYDALVKRYCVENDTFWADPLKRTYRAEFEKTWRPYWCKGNEDHFVCVCTCDWKRVSEEVRSEHDHREGKVHIYIVAGWRLPHSTSDQMRHIMKLRADMNATWASVQANGQLTYEFRVAEKLATFALQSLTKRIAAAVDMRLSSDVSVYMSNVFRADMACCCTRYYAGTCCTQDESAIGGVLTARGGDASDGFLLWGGTYVKGKVAGNPWACEGTGHGLLARVYDHCAPNMNTQTAWGSIKGHVPECFPEGNVGFLKLDTLLRSP